mmetsp:Transcript_11737/g.29676  ORF Transcript_11737/g.29676 Transcript_11737/m.29676 type:complete len:163 (+) Transcript_11737:1510-1998(+)
MRHLLTKYLRRLSSLSAAAPLHSQSLAGSAFPRFASGHVVAAKSGPRRPRRAALEITETAAKRIKHLLDSRDPHPFGVRVGLKHRGCNGLSFTMNYVEDRTEIAKTDEVVEDKGVKVIIDGRALLNVVGTEMDFVDDDLVSEFVFNNPNAKGTCGCGESFSV